MNGGVLCDQCRVHIPFRPMDVSWVGFLFRLTSRGRLSCEELRTAPITAHFVMALILLNLILKPSKKEWVIFCFGFVGFCWEVKLCLVHPFILELITSGGVVDRQGSDCR